MHGAVAPAIIGAYDFSRFSSIVDVGRGKGALLTAILKAHPKLRGVLFDRRETEKDAQCHLASTGLATRCEFMAGNFFDAVPAGYDAYVLAHVLHDWTDDQALAILSKCREAIPARGRL